MNAQTSPITGLLKFLGAVIISVAVLSIAMMITGTISPGSETLGSHRWITGIFMTVFGMIIGIAATYAPNPLDNPGNSSSIFTSMFEWVGLMTFFGGIAMFFSAQAAQFNF